MTVAEQTPDFEQIARTLHAELDDYPAGIGDRFIDGRLALIAEQLRLVWNARGAADIAAVDDIAHTNYEAIDRALRGLDR